MIFLSIVSHYNENEIIENFNWLIDTAIDLTILVVDNTGSASLRSWCETNNFMYIFDGNVRGYGANQNLSFSKSKIGPKDVFIVCNPDVIVDEECILRCNKKLACDQIDILGVKVFEDKEKEVVMSNNRRFPTILDAFISFLFHKKMYLGPASKPAETEWIGGSFMVFRGSCFERLGGFDEAYFMYYEDVDICYRARRSGFKIWYDPTGSIIHLAKRRGRSLMSKHFFWNLKSMMIFCWKRRWI